MKKLSAILLACLLVLAFAAGCEGKPNRNFIITEDFDGRNVGIIAGKTDENFVKKRIGKPKIKKYSTPEEGITALRKGKISGMILDAITANHYAETEDDLVLLMEDFEKKEYIMPVRVTDKTEENYLLVVGAGISRIKGDGTYDKLLAKYYGFDTAGEYTFDSNYPRAEGRVIKAAVDPSLGEPLLYKNESGAYAGLFIDLAYEIARDFHSDIQFIEMPRDKMLTALENKEADFGISSFTTDEELPQNILPSEPFFNASQYIVYLNPMMKKK